MSRWGDLAVWVGPTVNEGGDLTAHDGLVVHIASGFYEGTISWQKNPDAQVSSHFIIARDGRIAQMVDTDRRAWAQRDGNARWLSIECEGFAADDMDGSGKPWLDRYPGWDKLTDAQIDGIARIFLRTCQQYGVPMQATHTPAIKGLGYHSMGGENGYNWGHMHCPGEPIKAQIPGIVDRAKQLAGGQGDEDDMGASFGPIDIQQEGFTSLNIPPVEAGTADPRSTWLNIGNDTGGQPYALRLVALTTDAAGKPGWYPVAGDGHEDVVIAADERKSYSLKKGTYAVSIVRRALTADGKPVPADADHPAYAGHLTCCFERGAVIK